MLELRNYTKEQIREILNIRSTKTSNITDILNRAGYKYITSGRGENYRITITDLPGESIIDFAKKYLGISARSKEQLIHFLYLIAIEHKEYINLSAGSLECHTPACNDTIQKWIESLLDCGLLIETNNVSYYASLKRKGDDIKENGDYTYTKLHKIITKKEFDDAEFASNQYYQTHRDEIRKGLIASGELKYECFIVKKSLLEGWWPLKRSKYKAFEINKQFPHYNHLLELLSGYDFYEYEKEFHGNIITEAKELEEKMRKWEEEKEEKRRLYQLELENSIEFQELTLENLKESIDRYDEDHCVYPEEKTIFKNKIITKVDFEGMIIAQKKIDEAIAAVEIPIFSNIKDSLVFFNENVFKKGELYKYGIQ